MVAEVFRMIDEFPCYDVSNFGQVRNRTTGRILKPHVNNHGYLQVCLYKDKKRHNCKIHRLVSLTFIDNPDNHKCCDHKDRCRTNNHVSNLRWASYSTNNKNRKPVGNTNVRNIHWAKKAERYECHLTGNNGERIRKAFSVSKYGTKARALQYAKAWVNNTRVRYGYL